MNLSPASPKGPHVLDKEERHINNISLINLIQTTLGQGASLPLQAKGTSMAPFIKDGDILTLSPLPVHEPGLGDVIACKLPHGNKLVIHRIVKALKDCCLIRGDYCSEPDGLISRKDILGVVSRLDRDGTRITFGFGPIRILIAILSARNILYPLLSILFRRSSIDCRQKSGYQAL
jgi:hypothetical protein